MIILLTLILLVLLIGPEYTFLLFCAGLALYVAALVATGIASALIAVLAGLWDWLMP
jgi:Na+/H+ antiporter NhaD/arsenite permease-like protein